MQNINSIAELKNAIQSIETERSVKGHLLKEQFHQTYERFKPANLFKSAVKDVTSPNSAIVDNLIIPAIGIGAGHLSKKIIVGSSDNKYRMLIGYIVQTEVTNLIVQHPETIKSFGQFIFQLIFRKKEMNTQNQ